MYRFMGGGGGGGDGGDYSDYWKKLEAERAERKKKALAEQAAIDAETDPEKKLAMRRARYGCGDKYIPANAFVPWSKDADVLRCLPGGTTVKDTRGGGGMFMMRNDSVTFEAEDCLRRYEINEEFNDKISLFQGDICRLEVGGIVNAANSSLMGGGGIDGAIHSAAGPMLDDACRPLGGCVTGNTKATAGFMLPAEFILHTVGPMGQGDRQLRSCYRTCLQIVEEKKLKTIAFCCVGTGIFGFPLVRATHIALDETRKWLEEMKVRRDTPDKAKPLAAAAKKPSAEATAEPAEAAPAEEKPKTEEGTAESTSQEPATEGKEDRDDEKATRRRRNDDDSDDDYPSGDLSYNLDHLDKVVFCVFRDVERQSYEKLLPGYFPTKTYCPEKYEWKEGDDDYNRDDARSYSYGGGSGGMMGGGGGGMMLGGRM